MTPPAKGLLRLLGEVLEHGGPGHLLFVGGEPIIHRDLRAMVRYAAERGVRPMICTNGGSWTEANMTGLAEDGLSSVILSIEAHDVARHEGNRGLPDVCRKIRRANEVFEKIKAIKRRSGFPVANPTESLDEMQCHLRGEKERFGSLGGHKYFYLGWHLNLYRCHFWETPMCTVYEWDASRLIRDGCTRCMIDCYRDPSILQAVAIDASDAWHALRRGRIVKAARHLLAPRNLTSLPAVWEERRFIRGVRSPSDLSDTPRLPAPFPPRRPRSYPGPVQGQSRAFPAPEGLSTTSIKI